MVYFSVRCEQSILSEIIYLSALCTVAIPVYNRKEAVVFAVNSALNQSLPDLEVLVVDDGSTDGAFEAVQEISDSRLRVIRNNVNLGLFGNFNRCVSLASGKYVRILCTDDRLAADCLAKEVAWLESHTAVSMLSTRGEFIDSNGKATGFLGDDMVPGLYKGSDMIYGALWVLAQYGHNAFNYPSGILFRKKLAEGLRGFDSHYKLVGDVDFWLQLAEKGHVAISSDIGCQVLRHEGQAGSKVMQSGTYVDEWVDLLERWRRYVPVSDLPKLRRQMGAHAYWYARHFASSGDNHISTIYLKQAIHLCSGRIPLFFETSRLLRLKALAKFLGKQIQPPVHSLFDGGSL